MFACVSKACLIDDMIFFLRLALSFCSISFFCRPGGAPLQKSKIARFIVLVLVVTSGGSAIFAADDAPAVTRVCTPKVTANEIVVSPMLRYNAGQEAESPLTDAGTGFAWPDTPMGVIKTDEGFNRESFCATTSAASCW